MSWNDDYICPICNYDKCAPAFGNENSPVLIVGFSPENIDEVKGIPFSDRNGTVLRQQLQYLKWDMRHFRIMNLWQHKPNKNKECFDYGKELVIKEAQGKQAILLVGADIVKEFTDYSVADTCGMNVKSDYLSAPLIMPIFSLGIVYHGVLGEVKLALQKFTKELEKYYD